MILHSTIDWRLIFKFSYKNVLYSTTVSILAVVLNHTLGMNSWQIPITIIATLGTALAIILGFRNGSAYDRWWEGRKIWGGMVNDSRSYARQVLTMIAGAEVNTVQRDIINTHIGFINALRLQLREISDQDTWNREVYNKLKPDTLEPIRDMSNKATQLLIQQGRKLEDCYKSGFVNDYQQIHMDATLSRFSDYQGKAERIKNTPFPKAYEIFNRILLNLFILFLPFALFPIFSGIDAWWLVFPITIMISWVFFGIHEMGLLMANPFDNFRWDVPLDAICNTIEIDLLEAIKESDVPEKLRPVDGVLM